ncbi:MAG: aldehyde ferredoxin oxidoreductase family protein [Anaerolineae bacterium]|nr:aldehyde ferredoxin oxidoreductase family protein [Anaerolineae bacterium]
MGAYYLLKHTPPGADPLGPENTLSFMLSPTTGAPVSGQSRCTATAKSPLSGLIGDSQAGGFWPAQLKFAGFDGIVITGRSAQPVYLWIRDGAAELRDARHLWGMITGDAEAAIKAELGDPKIEVAQIGPAGERLAKLACIVNMSNRSHGRTGMGAVMGSKNLKAIAVRGRGRISMADPQAVTRLARQAAATIPDYPDMQGLQDYGTASVVNYQDMAGGLPTRNYTSGTFELAEALSGETMKDTILKENDTCYACSVRCKRVVETEYRGIKVDPQYGGPEYETLGTLGSYCAVGDLQAVALANQMCAQAGFDTIGAGATIAFAMECFERGILTTADTGGIELRFGSADAMLATLDLMIRREGLGDLLADGSAHAARAIGRGADACAVTVKDTELPAHMPQVKRSLALVYAVNPFGADHQSSEHDPGYTAEASDYSLRRMAEIGLTDPQPDRVMNREKAKLALLTMFNYSFMDTANLCQFVYGPAWQLLGPAEMAALTSAVTGWPLTVPDIQEIGERRLNLTRAFNAREGAGRELDTLPPRLFDEPLKGGASDGLRVTREELSQALDDYYELAGWDKTTGAPTRAKLEALGLGWAA